MWLVSKERIMGGRKGGGVGGRERRGHIYITTYAETERECTYTYRPFHSFSPFA